MDPTLNPSSRPRRGVLAFLGAGVTAALVGGAIVLGGSSAVEASGLSTFSSCAELRDWGTEAMALQYGAGREQFEEIGASIAADGSGTDAASGAPSTTGAASPEAAAEADTAMAGNEAGAPADATNVIVEGIDEPDLVERLGGDRALVVGGQTLAVADLADATMVASTRVPWGAQITYDADAGVAWSVGSGDDGRVLVQRIRVGDAALEEDGSWTTAGQLVSVRRQGDELILVATDGFDQPVMFESISPGDPGPGAGGDGVDGSGGAPADPAAADDAIPFAGGPVPCEQVLHPEGPAEPTATLLVVLPVRGPLEPLRSTQVVGSGSNVHVTADAAYLATPTWDPNGGTQTTGLHRFDLGSLTHTGSGAVEGSLLNDFSLSEHDGHLRVAVTIGGGFVGMPMPVEDFGGDIGEPIPSEPGFEGPAESPMVDDPDGTSVTTGAADTTDAIDPGSPVASSDGSDPARSAGSASSTSVPAAAPDTIVAEPGAPDGPETTTTIIDPSGPDTTVPDATIPDTTIPAPDDPTGTIVEEPMPVDPFPGPTVVEPGPEMEVINEIVVLDIDGDLDQVGRTPRFGHPGESLQGIRFEGDIAYAVTFLQTDPFYVVDLSDPTNPRIEGELQLPGFSAYLHPISATEVVGFGPDESGRASAKLFDVSDRSNPQVVDSIVLGDDSPVVWDHHAFVSLGANRFAVPANQWSSVGSVCDAEGCTAEEFGGVENHVVVLAVSGGRLVEEDRVAVALPESIVRVIPTSDGWGLLTSSQLTVVDGGGDVRGTMPLG